MAKPTKRVFSFEFKLDAVQLLRAGENKVSLTRELGLSSPALWWPASVRAGTLTPRERTVKSGERLPGKSAGLEGATVKVRAVLALKAMHRLETLLQVAGLTRSTFFYHQARLQAPAPQEALQAALTEAFTKSHGRYGHRRVHAVLLRQG